MRLVFSI